MLYLLFAIISSALVSIVMRLSDSHIKNNMVMFMANYAVCIILSIIFGMQGNVSNVENTFCFPIVLGIISGIMYLASFMLLQTNIKKNGVVLSATFMKLGVIVPTIMAITFFHESPATTTIWGIILALLAIIVINQKEEPNANEKATTASLLVILLIAGGFTDSLANIFDKCGEPSLKDIYLLLTFLSAFLSSLIMKIHKRQQITLADLGWGALIGIPNYFSARFLLLALSKVQAIIVFPVYNIGAIVLVTLTGVIIFHEKLSRKKLLALAIILFALILLNI